MEATEEVTDQGGEDLKSADDKYLFNNSLPNIGGPNAGIAAGIGGGAQIKWLFK